MLLKLNQIIRRGSLRVATAQYALKNPQLLKGMPKAGSQGLHREFTVQQATRLAICCHLVMGGVPLAKAGPFMDVAEKRVRTLLKLKGKEPIDYTVQSDTMPWVLEVLDGKFFRIWRGDRDTRLIHSGQYWAADSDGWDHLLERPRMVYWKLEVSVLQGLLQNKTARID